MIVAVIFFAMGLDWIAIFYGLDVIRFLYEFISMDHDHSMKSALRGNRLGMFFCSICKVNPKGLHDNCRSYQHSRFAHKQRHSK